MSSEHEEKRSWGINCTNNGIFDQEIIFSYRQQNVTIKLEEKMIRSNEKLHVLIDDAVRINSQKKRRLVFFLRDPGEIWFHLKTKICQQE